MQRCEFYNSCCACAGCGEGASLGVAVKESNNTHNNSKVQTESRALQEPTTPADFRHCEPYFLSTLIWSLLHNMDCLLLNVPQSLPRDVVKAETDKRESKAEVQTFGEAAGLEASGQS